MAALIDSDSDQEFLGIDNMNDEDDDQWLLNTFTKYKELHMYELNKPTQILEWNSEGVSVVVASFSEDSKNDIRDLLLPNKLLTLGREDNLALKVDFQNIRGGLSEHPILSCAVSSCNTIFTAGINDVITLWEYSDTNDMMKPTEVLKMEDRHTGSPTKCHVDISQNNLLLTGSQFSNTHIRTTSDYKVVNRFHFEEFKNYTLDALEFAENDTNIIITCLHNNGDAHIWDIREQLNKPVLCFAGGNVPPVNTLFTTSNLPIISYGLDTNNSYLARISKFNNSFDIFDIRNSQKAILNNFKIPAKYPYSINSIPRIQFNGDKNVSMSGFGNVVLVYRNLPQLLTGSDSTTDSSLFIHDGHKSHVTCHRWHPSEPELILSTEEIGHLHAWQMN